jgi:hypothetical protein
VAPTYLQQESGRASAPDSASRGSTTTRAQTGSAGGTARRSLAVHTVIVINQALDNPALRAQHVNCGGPRSATPSREARGLGPTRRQRRRQGISDYAPVGDAGGLAQGSSQGHTA